MKNSIKYGTSFFFVLLVLLSLVYLFSGKLFQVSAASNVPNTGDESQLMIWLAVLAVCIIGVIVMLVIVSRRKRKARSKHFR